MSEFTVQAESIDVERIMGQIRQRIKNKRDEDYTEEQIRELANVKLERFLEPENIRSNMLEYYQKRLKEKQDALRASPQAPPSFEFDPDIIYRSSRGFSGRLLSGIRRLLNPLLKFFFNPDPIVHALTIQQQINERQAEVVSQMVRTQTEFIEIAALNFEVMNNLVVEMTQLSIEMKNHKMRVESVAGRLDFDERRARSLERVVQYRDGSAPAGRTSGDAPPSSTDGAATSERRRRRRRRGRRRPAGAAVPDGAASANGKADVAGTDTPSESSEAQAGPRPDTSAPAEPAATVESGAAEPAGAPSSSATSRPETESPAPDAPSSAANVGDETRSPSRADPSSSSSSVDGPEPTDR